MFKNKQKSLFILMTICFFGASSVSVKAAAASLQKAPLSWAEMDLEDWTNDPEGDEAFLRAAKVTSALTKRPNSAEEPELSNSTEEVKLMIKALGEKFPLLLTSPKIRGASPVDGFTIG